MRSSLVISIGTAVSIGTAAVAALAGIPALAASAAPTRSVSPAVKAAGPLWPNHTVLAEPGRLGIVGQVVANGAVYALASANGGRASQLRRTELANGKVKLGPKLHVQQVAVGAGSVWVYGSQQAAHDTTKLAVYQINPASLALIRSRTLAPSENVSGLIGFAAGSGHDVWVGALRTILKINASTGAVVSTITLKPRLAVSGLATTGNTLYAAANGPLGGTVLFEFNASTGRELALNNHGALRGSVGDSAITAAPNGVWVSFRTGSLGATILLRQQGLRVVKLPGSGKTDLYAWAMGATTEIAGKSLFLARVDGQIGCVNPSTGAIRSRSSVKGLSGFGELLGSAKGGRIIYGQSPAGVIAINPPAGCR